MMRVIVLVTLVSRSKRGSVSLGSRKLKGVAHATQHSKPTCGEELASRSRENRGRKFSGHAAPILSYGGTLSNNTVRGANLHTPVEQISRPTSLLLPRRRDACFLSSTACVRHNIDASPYCPAIPCGHRKVPACRSRGVFSAAICQLAIRP
jgi:hypothetical protein